MSEMERPVSTADSQEFLVSPEKKEAEKRAISDFEVINHKVTFLNEQIKKQTQERLKIYEDILTYVQKNPPNKLYSNYRIADSIKRKGQPTQSIEILFNDNTENKKNLVFQVEKFLPDQIKKNPADTELVNLNENYQENTSGITKTINAFWQYKSDNVLSLFDIDEFSEWRGAKLEKVHQGLFDQDGYIQAVKKVTSLISDITYEKRLDFNSENPTLKEKIEKIKKRLQEDKDKKKDVEATEVQKINEDLQKKEKLEQPVQKLQTEEKFIIPGTIQENLATEEKAPESSSLTKLQTKVIDDFSSEAQGVLKEIVEIDSEKITTESKKDTEKSAEVLEQLLRPSLEDILYTKGLPAHIDNVNMWSGVALANSHFLLEELKKPVNKDKIPEVIEMLQKSFTERNNYINEKFTEDEKGRLIIFIDDVKKYREKLKEAIPQVTEALQFSESEVFTTRNLYTKAYAEKAYKDCELPEDEKIKKNIIDNLFIQFILIELAEAPAKS